MINKAVFETADAVVEKLAQQWQQLSQQGRPVHISLSGGSTPIRLFQFVANSTFATEIQWQNLHFWWGDERCVPPSDAESNFGEAERKLFSHVAIPSENIHRIEGELSPELGVAAFISEMETHLPMVNGLPQFDWILLGMGEDGHTASLFPNETDYDTTAFAVTARHPQSGQWRISNSAAVLENAQRITYLVLGANKAEMLAQINQNDPADLPYPAAKIRSRVGVTEWYLDSAAASALA